jgi:hypothetical protein
MIHITKMPHEYIPMLRTTERRGWLTRKHGFYKHNKDCKRCYAERFVAGLKRGDQIVRMPSTGMAEQVRKALGIK